MAKYELVKFSDSQWVLTRKELFLKKQFLCLDCNTSGTGGLWLEKLSQSCYAESLDQLVLKASLILGCELKITLETR